MGERRRVKRLEEACVNYALSALRGAVNMYYHYRSRGYPDDKCISIATKYMWGVIGSSGVISDERMRERFVYALRVMGALVPAMLEALERMPPTSQIEESRSQEEGAWRS